MGKALELIGVQATAPGAGAAFTAVSGNSLQVRDHRAKAWLVGVGSGRQTAGFTRITSPLLHDSTVGIQYRSPGQNLRVILPKVQELYSQDQLTVIGSGSGVAGDIESSSLSVFYEDLPGVDANLISVEELMRRGEEYYSFQNAVAGAAGGGYTGSQVITTSQDQLKANQDYAILGISLDTAALPMTAIRYVGPDFGNLGVGVQVSGDDVSRNGTYFLDLAKGTGLPCIPVFNASNKALTFISQLSNENAGTVNVTTLCARLGPRSRK